MNVAHPHPHLCEHVVHAMLPMFPTLHAASVQPYDTSRVELLGIQRDDVDALMPSGTDCGPYSMHTPAASPPVERGGALNARYDTPDGNHEHQSPSTRHGSCLRHAFQHALSSRSDPNHQQERCDDGRATGETESNRTQNRIRRKLLNHSTCCVLRALGLLC